MAERRAPSAPVDAVGRVQASFGSSDGGARLNQRARGGRVALPVALARLTGGMGYVGEMGLSPEAKVGIARWQSDGRLGAR
jgi:hypothetical protein